MPLYEYECEVCHHRFEKIQKFSDPLVDVCPVCGGVVKKLFSSPAFQFKGTGWYVTDYAKKSSGSRSSSELKSDSDGNGDSAKDSGSKDKDSATKKESKAKSESTPKSADKK